MPKWCQKYIILHFHCKLGHVTPHFDGNKLQRKNVMLKTGFGKYWNHKKRKKPKIVPKIVPKIHNFTFSRKV